MVQDLDGNEVSEDCTDVVQTLNGDEVDITVV